MAYDYDVIVIGCGPAGQKAAIKCAKVGKKVAIIDRRMVVGGQCLHTGTIPSKTFRAAIIYLSGYYERKFYGEDYRVKDLITAQDLVFRCNSIIRREIEVINRHLTNNDVHVLMGDAQFTDPHTVRLNTSVGVERHTAASFIICTGSRSYLLQDILFDNLHIVNTDDILGLQFLPKTLMVIGGGVIGLEYASMFSLLDIDVTVVSQYKELLPWVDREIVGGLINHMQRHGVKFRLGNHATGLRVIAPKQVRGQYDTGEEFEVEMVMYAAQRWGNTLDLNVEAAGLARGPRDHLEVNENYQTSVPHIYAAGDVIGFPSLASTAIDQGRKAANRLLGVPDVPYEPLFPYGIYTFPDMSMVGQSEDQLKKDGVPYETGVGYYRDSARGQIIGDEDGIVKLLFHAETRELLGVHIIGAEATELIHMGQAVLINHGKIDYFIDTVFNYPTLAEVYKIAALNGFNKTKASLPMDHM
jgi:NAD(P) transhydrogenase